MDLKRHELLELFAASIDNALNLYKSAQVILKESKNNKYTSLGLAELALEELGKSYSCLAFYSTCDHFENWKEFWKDWRNHDLKAHRAFFYEFFCSLRVELEYENPEEILKFPSVRDSFAKEKEASFYVDIDKGSRKIFIPANEISDLECIRRITSLHGLFNASFFIRDWMLENESEEFRNAISDYAMRTISTEMYQQQVLETLEEMKTENEQYNLGLQKIKELFNLNK